MTSILIIDDEAEVGRALTRVLERAGFLVTAVTGGAEGIAEFERNPAEVVITDIIMPKINGVEAIDFIRREFPSVRIIAISGGGNFGISAYQPNAITTSAYLAAAERAGAHMILTKPFESRELIQAVEQVLGVGHA